MPRKTIVRSGFSLVELSIVLVILGLLTGGILAGQSLIRAAALRSVTADFQRYQAAAQGFRDKYFSIPGDMNNATRFWQRRINNSYCVTNSAAIVNAAGSCDGDADGVIEGIALAMTNRSAERLQFWRQLSLAGLIEGNHPGIYDATAWETVGSHSPRSKLSNAGFYVSSENNGEVYTVTLGNYFEISSDYGDTIYPSLTPEEAWNIDTKMDDGKPAQGKIIARFWNNLCAAADDGSSAASDLIASYRLTDKTKQCNLLLRQAF